MNFPEKGQILKMGQAEEGGENNIYLAGNRKKMRKGNYVTF